MRGTYRFFQNGVLLHEQENLITTEGRRLILRNLAQPDIVGGSIAVGSGVTAPALTDSRLTMEFDRASIYLSSYDPLTNRVVFKTTLQEGLLGNIYEVGLYSTPYGTTSNGYPSRLLFTFDPAAEAWTGGVFQTTNARVGANTLRLTGTSTTVLSSLSLDISGYDNTDQLSFAFFITGTVPTGLAFRLRGADPAGYYEANFTTGLVAGYNVRTVNKSALTKTGVVDFTDIDSVEVRQTGGGTVDLDAIRIEDMSTDSPDHVLVSRTVLVTPTLKTGLVPLDVEYALDVNVA